MPTEPADDSVPPIGKGTPPDLPPYNPPLRPAANRNGDIFSRPAWGAMTYNLPVSEQVTIVTGTANREPNPYYVRTLQAENEQLRNDNQQLHAEITAANQVHQELLAFITKLNQEIARLQSQSQPPPGSRMLDL